MKPPSGAQVPPATADEISSALAALSTADWVRLRRVAAYRHQSLGLHRAGRNEQDLLSDALICALGGRRKWRRDVSLVVFLLGVMRSLASHIRAGKAVDAFDEIAPTSERSTDTERADPIAELGLSAPGQPDDALRVQQFDAAVKERFKEDPVTLLVYEGFLEGMSPAEIKTTLEIGDNEYNAAAKRLRRAAAAMAKGGPR